MVRFLEQEGYEICSPSKATDYIRGKWMRKKKKEKKTFDIHESDLSTFEEWMHGSRGLI